MKLYTEEQVKNLLNKMDVIYSLEDLTPIELPSEKYGIFNPQRLIFETLGGKYGLQSHNEHDQVDGYFDTYEEAELACLRKLIEIVK